MTEPYPYPGARRRSKYSLTAILSKNKSPLTKIGIVVTIIILYAITLQWSIINDNLHWFIQATGTTLAISVIAILMGFGLGIVVGLGRVSTNYFIHGAASIYVEALRGTPLLIQIFFIYFGLPSLGINFPNPFIPATLALGLNSAAYQAEIIRGGIQSIPKGQMEAARSTGMSYLQSMRHVILPQGFRMIIPPMTNEYVTVIKDSSLAYTIGVFELTKEGYQLVSFYFQPIPIFFFVALVYFTMTALTSTIMGFVERRYRIPGYMVGG